MKLEQIPGDYDNVDQRALELLETSILETLRMKYFIHSNIETL